MGQRVTFTVRGRPSRWMRPGQALNPKTGRVMRFTDRKAEAGKKRIAQEAGLRWKGPPACGPVILRVVAVFAIPKAWPRALRDEAGQARVMHIADPDLDQLVKQVQDALVGIAYHDDNQVCGYPNSAKRYGSPERTEITIEVLDQQEAQKTPGQREIEALVASGQPVIGTRTKRRGANRSKSGTGRAR